MSSPTVIDHHDIEDLVGLSIWDDRLPTPLAVVDRGILGRNIDRMSERAVSGGVSLRPHAKTHKSLEIAALQLAGGAIGLTVATVSELLAFIPSEAAGYMISQPLRAVDLHLLREPVGAGKEILLCVDDLSHARELDEAAGSLGITLHVVIILDERIERLGVSHEDAPLLARELTGLRNLRLRGVRGFAGRAYAIQDLEDRMLDAGQEIDRIVETAGVIRGAGHECDIVSWGSTPALNYEASRDLARPGTEWRPGNYVFNDRMQVSLGVAPEDCALRIRASVVSAQGGRLVLDAGNKSLGSTLDRWSSGYGLAGDGLHEAPIATISEECSTVDRAALEGARVGSAVMILPNHACEIPNLSNVVAFADDGVISGFYEPVARGHRILAGVG